MHVQENHLLLTDPTSSLQPQQSVQTLRGSSSHYFTLQNLSNETRRAQSRTSALTAERSQRPYPGLAQSSALPTAARGGY